MASNQQNSWIDFEHQHKGEGKTPHELAQEYKKLQEAANQKGQTISWVEFEHQHKGEGKTSHELAQEYKKAQNQY